MANFQTRKQVADLIGRSSQYVGIYVGRKQLIEEYKKIDTDHPINKAWIAKNMIRPKRKIQKREVNPNSPRPKPKKETQDLSDFESIDIDSLKFNTIDEIKKHRETKRIEADTELKKIELLKKKAKVLPLDFIIEWSGRNIRGIFGETVNFGNSIIEQICNELDADIETKLRFKKKFKHGFNEILKLGIKKQEPEAIKHAEDYALLNKW